MSELPFQGKKVLVIQGMYHNGTRRYVLDSNLRNAAVAKYNLLFPATQPAEQIRCVFDSLTNSWKQVDEPALLARLM